MFAVVFCGFLAFDVYSYLHPENITHIEFKGASLRVESRSNAVVVKTSTVGIEMTGNKDPQQQDFDQIYFATVRTEQGGGGTFECLCIQPPRPGTKVRILILSGKDGALKMVVVPVR